MSTIKRISGDYTIQSVGTSDRIFLNSGNVYVEGNLWISGNTQTVSTTNTEITNNVITLNANAATPNSRGASIVVARGSGYANAAITWNETVGAWQISEVVNGSYYTANIATTTTTSSFISNVSQDSTPSLGGNLNLAGHTIWDSTTTANVQLNFSNVTGTGGTGIYVTNNHYANVELASKTRSVAYSILFG